MIIHVCFALQVIHDICTKMALNYNAGGLCWPWSWLRLMLCPPGFKDTTAGGATHAVCLSLIVSRVACMLS